MNDPHLAAAQEALAQARLAPALLLAAHCGELGSDGPPDQSPAPYIALWVRLAERMAAGEHANQFAEQVCQAEESLDAIARRCHWPATLLAALNDLGPGGSLSEGQKVRVPVREFHAEMDLARGELSVLWRGERAATFVLHRRNDFVLGPAEFEVRRRRIDPVHYDPQGAATPRDYRGPFARHVLDISGGWSLHGLPPWDLRPLDVGLVAGEAALVYAALQVGARIVVTRGMPERAIAPDVPSSKNVVVPETVAPATKSSGASGPEARALPASPNRAEIAAAIERLPLVVGPVRRSLERAPAAETLLNSPMPSALFAKSPQPVPVESTPVRGSRAVVGWHSCVGDAFACRSAHTAPPWLHDADAAASWQAMAPAIDWPPADAEDVDLVEEGGDDFDDDRPETDGPARRLVAEEQGAAWPAPTGWQLVNLALSVATLIAVVWQSWQTSERMAALALPRAAVAPPASNPPAVAAAPAGPPQSGADPEFAVPAWPDRDPAEIARVNFEQPPATPDPAVAPPAEPRADLKMNVYVPQAPVAVGATAVYEIRVANRGAAPAVDVDVCCFFSEGFEPIGADGAPPRLGAGQVQFERISRIDPGQERVFRIAARADAEGARIFRPDVKCATPETHLFTDVTTQFVRPTRR